MIKLVHVEPNTVMRTVLADLLGRDDIEVVASAARLGELAPERMAESGADVLLVSIDDEGGFEQVRRWRDRIPGMRVLALVNHDGPGYLRTAMQAGLDGLVATREGPEAVGDAIALVAMGEKVFSQQPDDPASVRGSGEDVAPRRGPNGLTAIERVVLGHLQAGRSNQHIADLTGQEEGEVKVQVHAIFRKLKVRNRTQAALWAVRNRHLLEVTSGYAADERRVG